MSALKRFFIDEIAKECALTGEEFEHAKNVLRLAEGDEIVLLDNSGKEYSAVIAKVEKRQMLLNVIGENEGEREATANIALAFGYLKNADKNEFIVQKAVELGVKKIVAFSSKYSSAYMNANKLERLNKVAREATKQCLRSVAPTVEYAETLQEALSALGAYENKLFACEFAKYSEIELSALRGSTAIVIGSEGGFSQAEADEAKKNGFAFVSLGKRILRAETAAVALTGVVAFALGELGETEKGV